MGQGPASPGVVNRARRTSSACPSQLIRHGSAPDGSSLALRPFSSVDLRARPRDTARMRARTYPLRADLWRCEARSVIRQAGLRDPRTQGQARRARPCFSVMNAAV